MTKRLPPTSVVVEKCGLIVNPRESFVAASPDGVMKFTTDGENYEWALLVIKTYKPDHSMESIIPSYTLKSGKLSRSHEYYCQFQAQMFCGGSIEVTFLC